MFETNHSKFKNQNLQCLNYMQYGSNTTTQRIKFQPHIEQNLHLKYIYVAYVSFINRL